MPIRKKPKGLFISFEGGEGSGKSTQVLRLSRWLGSREFACVVTREPGGTELGRRIRGLLLEPGGEINERAELLLYQADRAHHVATTVRPALERAEVVLCDRFADSSAVYQGLCRGLGLKQTQQLSRFATGGLEPDLTFVLDIPAEAGLERVHRRAEGGSACAIDRMESESLAFHKKVRSGFLRLARARPSRYVIVDARQPEEKIERIIRDRVTRKLKVRGLWTP